MEWHELRKLVAESDNIVFFGGAGTSTESGIPDFRSAKGLFQRQRSENLHFRPEEILSRSFFMTHTELFFDYYLSNLVYPDAKPNKAHQILAQWEQQGKLKAIITQNIDGLHQLAGSRNVLELHGSVHRNYCLKCGKFFELAYILNFKGKIPKCDDCEGIVRPDVVLYQEPLDPDVMQRSQQYIADADVLIVAGTSLEVYPAAGLVHFYSGDKLILINKTATGHDRLANYVIHDSIGKVMEILTASNDKA